MIRGQKMQSETKKMHVSNVFWFNIPGLQNA